MSRRKQGSVLPLEIAILEAGVGLMKAGEPVYGFSLARQLAGEGDGSLLAHGTLYKALGRMTEAGLLEAQWEDPAIPESEGRPRRRLYRVTGAGVDAVAAARASSADVRTIVPFSSATVSA